MRLLAFETTCDETSVCLFEDGRTLSNIVFSQIALHRKYSGVVPELASRAHLEKISWALKTALKKAGYSTPLFTKGNLNRPRIETVVFSRGPGLPGALLVSQVAAQTAAKLLNAKLLGVNHLEGHFLAYEYEGDKVTRKIQFPCLALIVSGGHTELWKCAGYGDYKVIGRTRDDAAGEAFDKVAKLLGLPYPGGPEVQKAALKAKVPDFSFPRPKLEGSLDFSFSGLKTAVAYKLRDLLGTDFYEKGRRLPASGQAQICFAFEQAVADTLIRNASSAMEKFGIKRLIVGGGVAANTCIRKKFKALAVRTGGEVCFSEKQYCGDNAAMIALCGARRLERGVFGGQIAISPNLTGASWRS